MKPIRLKVLFITFLLIISLKTVCKCIPTCLISVIYTIYQVKIISHNKLIIMNSQKLIFDNLILLRYF